MELVNGASWICADHGLYRVYGVFHHGGVVIPMLFQELHLSSDIGISHFFPADMSIRQWWVHVVDVWLLAIEGVW